MIVVRFGSGSFSAGMMSYKARYTVISDIYESIGGSKENYCTSYEICDRLP